MAVVSTLPVEAFVDRRPGVGRQHLFVVDRRDRDVEGSAGAGALSVVDAEVERVGGRLTAVVVVGHQAARRCRPA